MDRDVAVKQPYPYVVRHQVRCHHLHLEHRSHVRPQLIDDDRIAVPVRRVLVKVVGAAQKGTSGCVPLCVSWASGMCCRCNRGSPWPRDFAENVPWSRLCQRINARRKDACEGLPSQRPRQAGLRGLDPATQDLRSRLRGMMSLVTTGYLIYSPVRLLYYLVDGERRHN